MPRETRRRPRRRGAVMADIATYVVLIAAVLFAVIPLLWTLTTSFKPESTVLAGAGQWIPEVFTLDNYVQVLTASPVPIAIRNSAIVGLTSVIATLVIAIPGAYAAARFDFKGKIPIIFFILATSMIPGIAIMLPLYFLASSVGLYDTLWAPIIVYTSWQVPITIWLLKATFETIPKEIEESGRIDGLGHIGAAVRLVLPLVVPGIAAAGTLVFVHVWGDFLIAATTTSDLDLRMVQVALYNYQTQYGIKWGELSAAIMLTLVPVIAIFFVAERRLVAGSAEGAVKH